MTDHVALRKESVDRNRNSQYSYFLFYGVALRKESVDRNIGPLIFNVQPRVALRKESVDRNQVYIVTGRLLQRRSPQGERG